MFVSSSGRKSNELGLATVQLIARMSVRQNSESRYSTFLQYMELTRPIGTVNDALGFVHLRYSGDVEVDSSVGRGTGTREQGHIITEEWFGRRMLLA